MELYESESGGLVVTREPEAVLEEAHRAAAALKKVIEAKPNKVMFNGEQYLEFEDWQTVGRFYGIAPRTAGSRPLTLGEVSGWEATAEAIHVPSGRVVATADAMCMTDEEKWRARPKYEWHYVKRSGGTSLDDPGKDELIWEKNQQTGKSRPKKEKVLAGEEAVPMFQLRSMAQTRAGSKALRNALAWVVVLAGYRPTPAEELPTHGGRPEPYVTVEVSEPTGGGPETPAAPEPPRDLLGAPDVAAERDILNGRVLGLAAKLKLKAAARAELWTKHCGHASPDKVDISALGALVEDLRQQCKAAGLSED
jgi:hypothetical protein